LFLDTTARDIKSAEPVYLRAIEAAPADADCLRNFAVFLAEQLKDFARADDYFARAIEVRVTFLYFKLPLLHDNFFFGRAKGFDGVS
jgi:tetratricopeptide (TPR) repeat protein